MAELTKKHHLQKVSDNTSKKCYLGYSRYHHLNESNVGRFEQVITDPFLFTNIFTDTLEAISL